MDSESGIFSDLSEPTDSSQLLEKLSEASDSPRRPEPPGCLDYSSTSDFEESLEPLGHSFRRFNVENSTDSVFGSAATVDIHNNINSNIPKRGLNFKIACAAICIYFFICLSICIGGVGYYKIFVYDRHVS